MLTKLAMELSIHRCANLQDLARKQRTDPTGAWRAISEAKRTDIAATGEIRVDFLKQWRENRYNTGASVNPPGVMASALNVALLRLQGHEFKDGIFAGQFGNAIYIPFPFIDTH